MLQFHCVKLSRLRIFPARDELPERNRQRHIYTFVLQVTRYFERPNYLNEPHLVALIKPNQVTADCPQMDIGGRDPVRVLRITINFNYRGVPTERPRNYCYSCIVFVESVIAILRLTQRNFLPQQPLNVARDC